MIKKLNKKSFRDKFLFDFLEKGDLSTQIPKSIQGSLFRKLNILDSAEQIKDLISPPGNRLEKLEPKSDDLYSIRVNDQYRIIFRYKNKVISDIQLDKHKYNLK